MEGRDGNGRFEKGCSGNPLGRPARDFDFSALCREHSEKALKVLVDIMTYADRDSDRVQAAKAILERGYGKAVTPLEISGKEQVVPVINVSLSKLRTVGGTKDQ